MIDWTAAHITRLGGKVDLKPNPAATAERDLPPILLAEFMVDPQKKTLCVYSHLDVQPAAKEDGWDTDRAYSIRLLGMHAQTCNPFVAVNVLTDLVFAFYSAPQRLS